LKLIRIDLVVALHAAFEEGLFAQGKRCRNRVEGHHQLRKAEMKARNSRISHLI
jgi:hypothetical protein